MNKTAEKRMIPRQGSCAGFSNALGIYCHTQPYLAENLARWGPNKYHFRTRMDNFEEFKLQYISNTGQILVLVVLHFVPGLPGLASTFLKMYTRYGQILPKLLK